MRAKRLSDKRLKDIENSVINCPQCFELTALLKHIKYLENEISRLEKQVEDYSSYKIIG